MELLIVGSQYPFPLPGEGAMANFLTKSGNTLQVLIPNLSKDELFSFKKGKIKAGFLYEKGDLLWLFRFYGKKGASLTLDSPFDVRSIPDELLALHDVTDRKQRLVIDIHVVDETNTVRALRSVTMPPALTVEFMSAVQEQISTLEKNAALERWLAINPDHLAKKTRLYELGK